ncbi:MAG: hypothetical protein PVI22_17700 [Lysobacterales bacterium]
MSEVLKENPMRAVRGPLFCIRRLSLVLLFVSMPAPAEDYSVEASQIAAEIVDVHPRGRAIEVDPEFRAARAQLIEIARDSDYPHYAMALGHLFHVVDDGHTASIPAYGAHAEFTFRFPLRVKRFSDGLYVIAAKDTAMPLLGTRLVRIANRPVDELLRGFVATSAGGSPAWPANFLPFAVTVPGWLMGLNFVDGGVDEPVLFEGQGHDGKFSSASLVAAKGGGDGLVQLDRELTDLEKLGRDRTNFVVYLDDPKALIVEIGAMQDQDDSTFEVFTAEVAGAMEGQDIESVVIDLRKNGGGNNELVMPLHRMLVKSRFNRYGGIFVLTSPSTFSAAMNFASWLERDTEAIFVGEPTGGSPNQFGDAEFETTTVSGTPYLISRLRWQDSSPLDKRRWILPDFPVEPTFDDFVAGEDRALVLATTHRPKPMTLQAQRLRLVRPWDRESQHVDWKFFYQD